LTVRVVIKQFAWGFVLWTAIALFYTSQNYLLYSQRQPVTWFQSMTYAFPEWYAWGVLSIAILYLARHWPIEGPRRRKRFAVLFALSPIFGTAHLFLYSLSRNLIGEGLDWQRVTSGVQSMFLVKIHFNVIVFWIIVGVDHAVSYYRRYREGELRAALLETQLARASLQALRMQLNPHFLFNTLHAITTLIRKDPDKAESMIARLSDLLRTTLDHVGAPEVMLRDELAFLERYLEIEKIRFGERLTIENDISSETLSAYVPNLILQPIVENAVRHGIASVSRGGRIVIRSSRKDERLVLNVTDNGAGGPAQQEGVGLSNTRKRLQQLYGANADLHIDVRNGWTVTVSIPFKGSAS
jgi:LytS/YehU family sensor histidine kinase